MIPHDECLLRVRLDVRDRAMRAANDIETIETTKKITTKTMTSETEPRDARGGDVDARRETRRHGCRDHVARDARATLFVRSFGGV